MSNFVLIYNRRTGRLEHEEFSGAHGRRDALHRRIAVEQSRESKDIEVVVLAADSLEQVKHTHGRYFSSKSDLVREAITDSQGGAVALA